MLKAIKVYSTLKRKKLIVEVGGGGNEKIKKIFMAGFFPFSYLVVHIMTP